MIEAATTLRSQPRGLSEVGALAPLHALTFTLFKTLAIVCVNFTTHANATAMHFPANAGLIFLTDELTNDRYLVDTRATLSIVPCS